MISKNLKKRELKLLGSKVPHARIRATGMVNGHVKNCWKK
jgi:DNA-3-methyladenine glycosylase I